MSLYIPRGCVTTSHAVDHIFEARTPDLAAERPSSDRATPPHFPSESVSEWQ
jgi:hypothetical protein